MALSDRLGKPTGDDAHRPRSSYPKEFEESARYEGSVPVAVTVNFRATEIPQDEQRWREEISRVANVPIPEDRRVELRDVRYWGDHNEPMIYCKFAILDRETIPERLDLTDILRVVKAARRKASPAPAGTNRAVIVAYSDAQVGKVGSRGDTEALIDRVTGKWDKVDAYTKVNRCDTAYLIDVGDCLENFEQTSAQQFTNDLSLPEQLRIARRLYTEGAMRLAKHHNRVVCTGVPSNHGRWRRGKGALGKPGDDYGIETLIAVADAFALNPEAFGHVEFIVPRDWEETIALNIYGTILAVAHGHQVNKPDNIPLWWARQVHGGQPAADADILLTGHFHSLRIQPTGRSVHTGKAKYWIMAPTLDNGSDFYRLKYGDDSDPGLLVFTVDANGWDNLRIL